MPAQAVLVDETMEWFSTADFTPYEGKYVAIVGKRVAAADEEPEIAYEKARVENPGQEVVMWKVMPSGTYIF